MLGMDFSKPMLCDNTNREWFPSLREDKPGVDEVRASRINGF
jgi:hypothetical protein